VKFTVVVPKDRIFVMGDHRDLSADSRCHLSDLSLGQAKGQVAFVPESLVVGPAVAIAWPLDRMKVLHRPATFATVPPPAGPAPAIGVIQPEGVSC
jgi:signal peptidase I